MNTIEYHDTAVMFTNDLDCPMSFGYIGNQLNMTQSNVHLLDKWNRISWPRLIHAKIAFLLPRGFQSTRNMLKQRLQNPESPANATVCHIAP